jgi:hypothetical protein
MTSPANGATLADTQVFNWTAGTGVTQYWLYIGSAGVGSNNLLSNSQGTNTSATVCCFSGVASRSIYVRLWWQISGTWQWNDYQYTNPYGVAGVASDPATSVRLKVASEP